jgi:hypothetical protein
MHPLLRFARASRLAFPILLAAAAAALKLRGGVIGSELTLVIGAGALLGWAIAVSFESVAVLLTGPRPEPISDRHLEELEREKEIVLRSIKDIELDTSLHKLEEADAKELCAPLRQRAVSLLHEIDRSRANQVETTIEAQIESELKLRLGGDEKPGSEVQG